MTDYLNGEDGGACVQPDSSALSVRPGRGIGAYAGQATRGDQIRVRRQRQLRSRDTGSLVGSEEFRYDPAANRLDFNARKLEKVKDNRIKRWRDQEYRYDPWGNLIEKRSGHSKLQSFSYDCENRLVRAETLVNGQLHSVGTYRYDSLGRRIAKSAEIAGETELKHFLWQGLRMLREETPGQSILYLYEPGSYAPLARVDQEEGAGQKVYYFHTDQIGTPLELTDSEGEIVWQSTYRSWGSVEQMTVIEVEQNLRFQGQYFDNETQLHYNTFRYYEPEIGRFISQDPIGLGGDWNLYQYVANPTAWVDPLGLDALSILAGRGYSGVTKTLGGGLDYSGSNALYAKNPNVSPIVTIEYTGDYIKDFEAANKVAELNQKTTPRGYVWHHLDDYEPKTNKGTMQLVEQRAHQGVPHKGGVAQYKAATGKSYTFPARKPAAAKKVGGTTAC